MDKQLTPLSASRIKTFQSCSWMYYCKYILGVPDKSNDGASRGSICHAVFECLGNPRHKRHYDTIVKNKDVFSSEAVKRMVERYAVKLNVDDPENIESIKTMTLNGLMYDFFGKTEAAKVDSHSELKFDMTVDEDGKKYRILGFIDKLFLYKQKKIAIIRDFKSSKSVFSGKDVEDNLQDQFYSLAISKLYPEFLKRKVEFIFLKFDLDNKGVVRMQNLSDDDLEGFEYMLTEIQKAVDSFSEKDARGNMAKTKDYPSDGSFSGPLLCGRNKFDGQLKKDGAVMWGCPFKWAIEYYVLYDKEGKKKGSFRVEESHLMQYDEGDTIKVEKYAGCPAWNRSRVQ
jgi:ATP-dependent helicase/DNAse subunit B